MILAVEIGGTKLQSALVDPAGSIVESVRTVIDRANGARGILAQLQNHLAQLGSSGHARYERIGVGFGGPVSAAGVIYKSHQVAGWDGFDLATWFEKQTGRRAIVANDCDAAALGEARWGAGRAAHSMFYVTVGTGVGGGWVVAGQRQGAERPAIAEIGHLRPGLTCTDSHATVESMASGAGIAQRYHMLARQWFPAVAEANSTNANRPMLETGAIEPGIKPVGSAGAWASAERFYLEHATAGDFDTRSIALAAEAGDLLAQHVFAQATTTLGWAIAQVSTITAAERIVIGGGVAKQSETLFWRPVRLAFEQFAFGPLRQDTQIIPAELGDDVVLVGAAAVAALEAR